MADSVGKRNPLLAAGLSLAMPGAGQFYNRRYVKGVLYLGTEVGLAFYGYNRYKEARELDPEVSRLDQRYRHLLDSLGGIDTSTYIYDSVPGFPDSVQATDRPGPTVFRMAADTARFKRDRLRYGAYQSWWWAASCYLYGVMDAIDKTGVFDDDEPRNPQIAGWLSAVPFLGLGQIYNGALSKAGMIFMVQSSLAYMALNNHLLLTRAEDQLQRMANPSHPEYAVVHELTGNSFVHEWETLYKQAFRNRNTYLWYSLFFYFYNIFDAVVDAHLHDYDKRMRLEPDLQALSQRVGMKLNLAF
ncbi:MAG: hypothetical protein GF331_24935 [Chitinivibrionales bacterium]|nr:hypothetical protein [Chitinivibrionales bacterium]